MIELAANLLVAFLLVLTTSWCVLLYRRLGRLRVERSDIEDFVTAIDTASQRAEAAIAGIRESALEAQRALGGQKELAQQRIGELPKVKLRLGRFGVDGQQKGVDLRIGLDLVAHARNGAADVFFLVSGDDDLVDRYRTRLAEWQAEISSFVSKRGGAYVQVPADIELADLLFDVLRRRRVVE